MKKIYSIIANGQVSLEGQVIEAGHCIGMLTTEQPIGNVQSLIRFGNASLHPVASEPAMVKRKAESKAKPLATENPESEPSVDPDSLNQLDDNLPTPTKEPEKAKEPEPEVELDPSFDSLDKKWAKALTVHGLNSRDEVAKFVNEGGNLKDVDGIGNKTKVAIEAWLK
jgi:hypothetical protein